MPTKRLSWMDESLVKVLKLSEFLMEFSVIGLFVYIIKLRFERNGHFLGRKMYFG